MKQSMTYFCRMWLLHIVHEVSDRWPSVKKCTRKSFFIFSSDAKILRIFWKRGDALNIERPNRSSYFTNYKRIVKNSLFEKYIHLKKKTNTIWRDLINTRKIGFVIFAYGYYFSSDIFLWRRIIGSRGEPLF
jgi:hypothetical protein